MNHVPLWLPILLGIVFGGLLFGSGMLLADVWLYHHRPQALHASGF